MTTWLRIVSYESVVRQTPTSAMAMLILVLLSIITLADVKVSLIRKFTGSGTRSVFRQADRPPPPEFTELSLMHLRFDPVGMRLLPP